MFANSQTSPLAIVIPAYKSQFLRAALQSIAAQTDKHFRLYIGDDASPEPVAEIVREFSEKLPLQYHRFERNLGKTSLVRHWERCVRLSTEPWVWIFSDDDCMDENCVAAFFAELKNTAAGHDLYRFNTIWINGAGVQTVESSTHPVTETGADFLLARLRDSRNSCLQELIFSRRAWESAGGIPDFPLAWNSDDAFIARLGVRRPIKTIAGPRVSWRVSEANISNDKSAATANTKLKASADFVRWTLDFFETHAPVAAADAIQLTEQWFFHCAATGWRFLNWSTCAEMDALAADVWGRRRGWGFRQGMKLNFRLATEKIRWRFKRRA